MKGRAFVAMFMLAANPPILASPVSPNSNILGGAAFFFTWGGFKYQYSYSVTAELLHAGHGHTSLDDAGLVGLIGRVRTTKTTCNKGNITVVRLQLSNLLMCACIAPIMF